MGVVGLDLGIISTICDKLDIEFDERLIRKLKVIEGKVLSDMNSKAKEK